MIWTQCLSAEIEGFWLNSFWGHRTLSLFFSRARTKIIFLYLITFYFFLTIMFSADPLVGNIAAQYISNREEHDRTAREWTRRYAT